MGGECAGGRDQSSNIICMGNGNSAAYKIAIFLYVDCIEQPCERWFIMAMSIERKRKVVIGRIHVSPWVKEEFEERLIKLFTSGEKYIPLGGKGVSKFIWVFGDPLVKQLDGETVLFARLGKINKNLCEIAFIEKK